MIKDWPGYGFNVTVWVVQLLNKNPTFLNFFQDCNQTKSRCALICSLCAECISKLKLKRWGGISLVASPASSAIGKASWEVFSVCQSCNFAPVVDASSTLYLFKCQAFEMKDCNKAPVTAWRSTQEKWLFNSADAVNLNHCNFKYFCLHNIISFSGLPKWNHVQWNYQQTPLVWFRYRVTERELSHAIRSPFWQWLNTIVRKRITLWEAREHSDWLMWQVFFFFSNVLVKNKMPVNLFRNDEVSVKQIRKVLWEIVGYESMKSQRRWTRSRGRLRSVVSGMSLV